MLFHGNMQSLASIQCTGIASSTLFKVNWRLSNAGQPYEASNVFYSTTQPITIPNLTNNATYTWDMVSMNSNGIIKGTSNSTVATLPTVMGRIGGSNSPTAVNNHCTFGSTGVLGDFTFGSAQAVTGDRMYLMQTICQPGVNANFSSDFVGIYDATSSAASYVNFNFNSGLAKRIPFSDSNKVNLFTCYDPLGKYVWSTYLQVCPGQTNVPSLANRVYDTCASANGTTAFAGSFGSSNMQVFCNGVSFGSSNLFNSLASGTYSGFVLGLNSRTGIPSYGLRLNAVNIRLANKPSDNSLYIAAYLASSTGNRLYYGGFDLFGNGSFTDYVDATATTTGGSGIVLMNIVNGVPQTPKITITNYYGTFLQSLKTDSSGNVFISFITNNVDNTAFSITDSTGTPKSVIFNSSTAQTRNNCIVKLNSTLVYQWTTLTQLQLDNINASPPNTATSTGSMMCLIDVTPAGNVVAAFAPGTVYSSNASKVTMCSSYKVETAVNGISANSSSTIGYRNPTTALPSSFVNSTFLLRLDGTNGGVISHTGFAQTDPSTTNVGAAMVPMSIACSAQENFVLGWKVFYNSMNANSPPYAYTYQNSNATEVTLCTSSNYGLNNLFGTNAFNWGQFGRQYVTGFDSNTKCSWESGILPFDGNTSQSGELSIGLSVTDNTYVASTWVGSYFTSYGFYDLGMRSIAHQAPVMVNRYNYTDRSFVTFGSNGAIV
jgi:hypothetical protein